MMTTEIKKVCCYVRTRPGDTTLQERIDFLKAVVALHEDWDCVDFIIDKTTRVGLDRPVVKEVRERMARGELKYMIVTHFSVLTPNAGNIRKLTEELRSFGCGIVALHEKVNTLLTYGEEKYENC